MMPYNVTASCGEWTLENSGGTISLQYQSMCDHTQSNHCLPSRKILGVPAIMSDSIHNPHPYPLYFGAASQVTKDVKAESYQPCMKAPVVFNTAEGNDLDGKISHNSDKCVLIHQMSAHLNGEAPSFAPYQYSSCPINYTINGQGEIYCRLKESEINHTAAACAALNTPLLEFVDPLSLKEVVCVCKYWWSEMWTLPKMQYFFGLPKLRNMSVTARGLRCQPSEDRLDETGRDISRPMQESRHFPRIEESGRSYLSQQNVAPWLPLDADFPYAPGRHLEVFLESSIDPVDSDTTSATRDSSLPKNPYLMSPTDDRNDSKGGLPYDQTESGGNYQMVSVGHPLETYLPLIIITPKCRPVIWRLASIGEYDGFRLDIYNRLKPPDEEAANYDVNTPCNKPMVGGTGSILSNNRVVPVEWTLDTSTSNLDLVSPNHSDTRQLNSVAVTSSNHLTDKNDSRGVMMKETRDSTRRLSSSSLQSTGIDFCNTCADGEKHLASAYDRLIKKDVDRTFPHRPLFSRSPEQKHWTSGQRALCRMLQYISIERRRDLGYCQGMNFLAATFLQVFGGDEITAARCFNAFLFRTEIGRMFEPSLSDAQLACRDLDALVEYYLPNLHDHLNQLGQLNVQTM